MQKFILITVIDADYYFDAGILYSVDSYFYQTIVIIVLVQSSRKHSCSKCPEFNIQESIYPNVY